MYLRLVVGRVTLGARVYRVMISIGGLLHRHPIGNPRQIYEVEITRRRQADRQPAGTRQTSRTRQTDGQSDR